MAIQFNMLGSPKFDQNGYCLTCGQLGLDGSELGLICTKCNDDAGGGLEGLFNQRIDYEGTVLSDAWDKFSQLVHEKLMQNHRRGYTGWDDPEWSADDVKAAMLEHIEKGDPVDIAAFAMFWYHRKGTGNG